MKERTQKIFIRFLKANTYLSYEDLSQDFLISERTLRNELALINEYLATRLYPTISKARGKGLILDLEEKQRQTLLSELINHRKLDYYRPEERFLALLFDIVDSTKTTILYKMEERLQVSKSTLDEDMRKIRQFLQDYGIFVISLPKQGIVLHGDERSIRSMLYDVINSMTNIESILGYKDSEVVTAGDQFVIDYLGQDVLQIIGDHYEGVFYKSRFDVNQVYRNQIILFLGIWIRRILEGNTVSDLTRVRAEIKEGSVRHFVDVICQEFGLYPSLNEIKYITFIIESFNPKDMNNSFDWVTAQLIAIQLIENVEKVTGVPFSEEEEDLYEGLYKHITGLLSRAKNDLQVYNPLKETIKESYPEIYNAVACYSKQIEKYINKSLSEDEIGFLTIYFSTSKSRIKSEKQYVYQAVVVCNHGISTGKLLAANLKEQFNIEIVAVLSSHELSVIDKLDVDLVFSTIEIDYYKKPVLLLNPILRESDKKEVHAFLLRNNDKRRAVLEELDATKLFQEILSLIQESGVKITRENYQKAERLFKKHNLKFNWREIQPMLQDILKDTQILLNEECKNWRETISKVAEPLLTEQVIEERYIDAMIKSVENYGPYIVVAKHLALAHARPEDGVNNLGVSVMTLKEPINFGNEDNDPVKIVFCLAAVDSYSHLNIMKSLIELINDESKLNRLIDANDIDSFKNILFENEFI